MGQTKVYSLSRHVVNAATLINRVGLGAANSATLGFTERSNFLLTGMRSEIGIGACTLENSGLKTGVVIAPQLFFRF